MTCICVFDANLKTKMAALNIRGWM